MKICPAPIGDFLFFLDEKYQDRENHDYWHVLQLMNEYYTSITKVKTIMPVGGDFLTDWCGYCDYDDKMVTCPNIPGGIVYKTLRNDQILWGIIVNGFRTDSVYRANEKLRLLDVMVIDDDGRLKIYRFVPSEWEGWGMPVRYFSFPEYIPSDEWELGERIIKYQDRGHDVMQLSAILAHFIKTLQPTCRYDDNVLAAMNRIQDLLCLPRDDAFDINTVEGEKIIKYCLHGYSHKIKP